LVYEKKYRDKHPRDAKIRKVRSAKYYQENIIAINKRNTDYYNRNRKTVLAKIKKYRKSNPEAISQLGRLYQRNRRALVKGAPGGGWSIEEERQLILDYDHRCAYCGKKMKKIVIDHVIPLSRGGSHSINNIVPACNPCNGSKHNKPLLVWMFEKKCIAQLSEVK
jgi:5-methylcytosine-specific restriction endonuclease McrA